MNLEERVVRDAGNAVKAQAVARNELTNRRSGGEGADFVIGQTEFQSIHRAFNHARSDSLRAIERTGFQAMTEVVAEVADGRRSSRTVPSLWYANVSSVSNEVLDGINVVSWTHPGLQIGLTGDLGEEEEVPALGYTLLSVTPVARGRFSTVAPSVMGLYEPGGRVGLTTEEPSTQGLRAVKLDMTKAQVDAFISRMSGLMIVTGAPGSGKTTVALQRVRFLYDQQGLRTGTNLVPYTPELTRVFLANTNLIGYTRELLARDLRIPEKVVEFVPRFLRDYLSAIWKEKDGARPRSRKLQQIEQRARQAVFGLGSVGDLRECWRHYERQIGSRLEEAETATWKSLVPKRLDEATKLAVELAEALKNVAGKALAADPLRSKFRMDAVFREVQRPYEGLRMALHGKLRDRFDTGFTQWLYRVYDPLDAIATYFAAKPIEAKSRVRRGTGARGDEDGTLDTLGKDWRGRLYGSEEVPWLAWLLRFALPEEGDGRLRFRAVPSGLPRTDFADQPRWTHVVVDEAQDLSVAEASLLSSFVHPDGALTIAADFRQIVSPVHGMMDSEALKVACPLHDRAGVTFYPFARNMRQSRQIGTFLRGFYERAFGEAATFEVSDRFSDALPQLIICRWQEFALRIRQVTKAFAGSQRVASCALLQINEDAEELQRLRDSLRKEGVEVSETWKAFSKDHKLVTSSVERVKGLEYDACIVLGLDRVKRSSLNFAVNRAYVALSRPCRRLVMLCEEYPEILRNIETSLFESWGE